MQKYAETPSVHVDGIIDEYLANHQSPRNLPRKDKAV